VALAFATVPASARAQCADGSPPPCRTQQQSAAPRRVNPPLDDRTWIVVPFDNLAKADDIDWMRAASVNLLYLDMSRWKDIRVIDDERVADLVRETPEASSAATLSLNAAMAVAKRAGAGRLVMGDLLKLGTRTAVTAKVYNVRTGQRLRSVREETAVQDSVMPLFGKLAQRILNVAPPQGANVGALGTTSVGAYQAYLEGVTALNRYDLQTAGSKFDEAIARDSTFALAHYKQALTYSWANPGDPRRRSHVESANRLSASLPARERSLIRGALQQTTGDWTRSCDTFSGLLAADSSDTEAWFGYADCLFHDPTIEVVGGDTTRLRFRADYNQSIRAFERVLRLDPTYHLAYQHIIDALAGERHPQVCHANVPGQRCTVYTSMLIRSGDSIAARPAALSDTAKLRQQGEEYLRTSSRRLSLNLARNFADAWVNAAPDEPQARRALARILVLQGQYADAERELARIKGGGSVQEEMRVMLENMEVAWKLGRPLDAIRRYDEGRQSALALGGAANRITFGNAIAGFGPAFGRLVEFDSLMIAQMRLGGAPELLQQYQKSTLRGALTGSFGDSVAVLERRVFDTVSAARGVAAATRSIAPTLMFALRAPRATWPAIDTTITDLRLQPAIALRSGDRARLKAAAEALDSVAATLASAGVSDSALSILAAEAHLALNDTTAALRSLRYMLDASAASTLYFPQNSGGYATIYFVPRAMLLRADLASAIGQTQEARVWYQRFIDTWSTAVPELQPTVERARQSLARLSARP
jgi:tetratricopeptide (TPR) repeat protein/TolB-like protein